MRPIFVYHDYAHHNASLWFALTRHYQNVRMVDANDIIGGVLNENPAAFIMPGGASRFVADKLNGAGNAAIKNYVAAGGVYAGICAGAYYACKTIYWHNGAQKIEVTNELALFGGASQGPIAMFCTGDDTASIAHLLTSDGQRLPTLYWGGPRFFNVAEAGAHIEARYEGLETDDAAIISGTYGKGRWLLTSNHPEFDDTALNLMQFNVIDNRYADLAKLPRAPGMTLDYFYALLDGFLEQ